MKGHLIAHSLLWGGHVWSIPHKGTSEYYEMIQSTIFSCLVSSAVHIEMTKSMETDSFILALRHFTMR